jgi:hypothetical protein
VVPAHLHTDTDAHLHANPYPHAHTHSHAHTHPLPHSDRHCHGHVHDHLDPHGHRDGDGYRRADHAHLYSDGDSCLHADLHTHGDRAAHADLHLDPHPDQYGGHHPMREMGIGSASPKIPGIPHRVSEPLLVHPAQDGSCIMLKTSN